MLKQLKNLDIFHQKMGDEPCNLDAMVLPVLCQRGGDGDGGPLRPSPKLGHVEIDKGSGRPDMFTGWTYPTTVELSPER